MEVFPFGIVQIHFTVGLPQATFFILHPHHCLQKYIMQYVSLTNATKAYVKYFYLKKNWCELELKNSYLWQPRTATTSKIKFEHHYLVYS